MQKPTLWVKPGPPSTYGITIGAWDDPEQIRLEGFESFYEAWVFCISNGLPDPDEDKPDWARKWTLHPPAPGDPVQLKLL